VTAVTEDSILTSTTTLVGVAEQHKSGRNSRKEGTNDVHGLEDRAREPVTCSDDVRPHLHLRQTYVGVGVGPADPSK
jgi:hypothetical protein